MHPGTELYIRVATPSPKIMSPLLILNPLPFYSFSIVVGLLELLFGLPLI
jgi:hypothetical protein